MAPNRISDISFSLSCSSFGQVMWPQVIYRDQSDGFIQNTRPTRWLQTKYPIFPSLFPAATLSGHVSSVIYRDQSDGFIQNTRPIRWLQTKYPIFPSLFPAATSARSRDFLRPIRWFHTEYPTNQMAPNEYTSFTSLFPASTLAMSHDLLIPIRITDQSEGSKQNIRPIKWLQTNIRHFFFSFLILRWGYGIYWDQSDGSIQNKRLIRGF